MASTDSRHEARKAKAANQSGLYAAGQAAQRFWQRSYAGDYVGLMILLVAYVIIQFFAEPFHKMFRLNDPRIQHPHAAVERVPPYMLFIYAGAVPAAILCFWNLVVRLDPHKAHVTILGLAISIITTTFLTDVFKNAVGRPRPDLLARCSPSTSAPLDELVTIDVCTEKNHHLLHDGWRSFPSGHSSFAFAGLGWLAFFLISQTRCLQPRASFATFILCAMPLVGAAFIGISRLEDYRHDVGDVVCGSILGFTVAYFNWRRYYPNLRAKDCDGPFSPPTSGRGSPSGGFRRVRDEEEGDIGRSDSFAIANDGDESLRARDT